MNDVLVAQASAQTPHKTAHLVMKTLSWVLPAATLIIGIVVFMKGRSISIAAQVGASDGTITDATDYYTKSTNGSSMVTLGAGLIAVSLLAFAVIAALAGRTSSTLVSVALPAGPVDTTYSDAAASDLEDAYAEEGGVQDLYDSLPEDGVVADADVEEEIVSEGVPEDADVVVEEIIIEADGETQARS